MDSFEIQIWLFPVSWDFNLLVNNGFSRNFHLPVNNGFDTALGRCQTHYSPVGRMKIPGEAIIRPVHGNYTALSLLTESALLYKNGYGHDQSCGSKNVTGHKNITKVMTG